MNRTKLIALLLCAVTIISVAIPGSLAVSFDTDSIESNVQIVDGTTEAESTETEQTEENPAQLPETAEPEDTTAPTDLELNTDTDNQEQEPQETAPAEESPAPEGENTDTEDKSAEEAQEPEPEEGEEEDKDEDKEEEKDEESDDSISRILEQLIDKIKVTASGNLPEGATLNVAGGSELKAKAAEAILNKLVGTANYLGVYSISVDSVETGTPVEITLDGLDVPKDKHVYVLHLLDSKEAIEAIDPSQLLTATTGSLLSTDSILSNVTELLQSIKELASGSGTLYATTIEAELDDNGSISFTTDSFSDFIVYTVDFHYNDYTYSIPGESSILLSELFAAIGFDTYTAAEASEVTFSNPELLTVTQLEDGSDWLLQSLQAFNTEESLEIKFSNGDSMTLKVTDIYMPNADKPESITGTIVIGINESYYDTKTTYSSSNGNSSTYHAFPAEPSGNVSAEFSRASNNSGSWLVGHSGDTVDTSKNKIFTSTTEKLSGTADSYISTDILSSEYFIQGTSDITSWGIYDSTGVITRSFLKNIDFSSIISLWITHMQSEKANNYFIKNPDGTDWSNAKAEDYELIPYVVKYIPEYYEYESYATSGYNRQGDRWVIDAVIVPKTYVNLSYDLNIPTGGSSVGANIPTKSYESGSVENVYLTPTAYDSTIKVYDKDGRQLTFLYWQDEAGNEYGGDNGSTKITLTEDTVLEAVWSPGVGGIKVTKKLVDSDKNTVTDDDTLFQMQVTLETSSGSPDSNSYDYRVNDSNGVIEKSGKITSGEIISLKAGQHFTISDIDNGDTFTVAEVNIPDGYDKTDHVVKGTISTAIAQRTITNTKVTTSSQSTATLTINKDGMQNGETAIFKITGDGLGDNGLSVTVANGGSVTVSGLTVGETYTVTEDTSWSWRYTPSYENSNEVTIAATGNTLNVTNTSSNSKWLSGETSVKNVFGKG